MIEQRKRLKHGPAENDLKSIKKMKSWNGGKPLQILKDGITEWLKGGMVENVPNPLRQKIPQNPKIWNDGKSPEILQVKDRIMERQNGGKCPKILKDRMMENHPIFQKREL